MAPTPVIDLSGIAFDDSGTLFGIDVDYGSMTLYALHPATGAATAIGVTGATGGEGALVYDPAAGVLFSKSNAITGGGATLELLSIDPATGVATTIGNMGLGLEADVTGLSLLPDDTLLAWDPQSALADRMLSIDKTTGVASVIGATGTPGTSSVGGLARDPDTGIYYLSDGFDLYSVNPVTGAATLIGSHGPFVSGLSFGPPLACMLAIDEASTLWDIDGSDGAGSNARSTGTLDLGGLALSPSGTLYATRTSGNGRLYTLDTVTGAATLIGPVLDELEQPIDASGLAFDDSSGVLYVAMGGDLVQVDPASGASTVLGPTPASSGLEVVGPCGAFGPPAFAAPGLPGGALVALALLLATAGCALARSYPLGRRVRLSRS